MASAARSLIPHRQFERLRAAREIMRREADAVHAVAASLGDSFCDAVALILGCRGRVVVTGIGKAGLIGQKIVATFSSTGTRSQFLHPSEAVHGDLGCLDRQDVVLALSNSGETEEVCRLIPILDSLHVPLVSITARAASTLGTASQIAIELGVHSEADANGLAPSTTTTIMLAVGDALALVASQERGFTASQFAVFHPGGSLGKRFTRVADLMRPIHQVRVAPASASVRHVFTQFTQPGRRSGAVLLTDPHGKLAGIFTDSDLARLLERRCDDLLDGPIAAVMTARPTTVTQTQRLADVVEILSGRKISELPVIDAENRPVGLIDITDVIGCLPVDVPA